MTLFDKLNGSYTVKAVCKNCKEINLIRIKKGITINEFFHSKKAMCETCGCPIDMVKTNLREAEKRDGKTRKKESFGDFETF